MLSHEEISHSTKQAAMAVGFDLAGIASVREEDFPELGVFSQWVEAGHAGEMKYLEKRSESGHLRRASVKNAAPWAKSVIVCALNYNGGLPYSTQVQDAERGWISRYAWGGKDYHDSVLARLRQVEAALRSLGKQHNLTVESRCYVDTGPIVERVYAKYAGIGWFGKNTCIINQKLGSWIFLGVILTSLEIAPDLPAPDRCGSCTRCIDACPTQAFTAPGKLDARRCIAYLTIEKRGEIPLEFRDAIGHQVFGCDICQDVCPWNNKAGNAPMTSAPEFQPQPMLVHPELMWLAEMSEDDFRRTFRGSPVKRTKYAGLRRNLAIAMGNSGNAAYIPVLEKMCAEGDQVIADHARWAIKKLRSGPA